MSFQHRYCWTKTNRAVIHGLEKKINIVYLTQARDLGIQRDM